MTKLPSSTCAKRYADRSEETGLSYSLRTAPCRPIEYSAASKLALLKHVRHHEAIEQARLDLDALEITDEQFAKKNQAFTDWRQRAATFDAIIQQYLDMAANRVRILHKDPIMDCLRRTLLTLALAVDSHRDAHAGEESLADTALWARLSTLPWPDAESRTLADAVEAERARRRRPARANHEGFIEIKERRVFGETVDVADLILEVTDHVDTSISRPLLVDLWKQRTPDLTATEAAKVTAARQKGSYSTHRLRNALLFLENLGAIAREADEARSRHRHRHRKCHHRPHATRDATPARATGAPR
ncbi:hypothetical protein GCM10011609_85280 [Lentzea pudingi]|uniref:Uncharacterized protein n=1 Tax=Lentzea pudingi TaxID=1789439 RepID=A0ABQ2IT66_9PSEU|nr:hypothetical protein [Lentzea pudingi]GGN28798.1 hypothetical protein GCM10011609_85280 [Lentzea pudingi]